MRNEHDQSGHTQLFGGSPATHDDCIAALQDRLGVRFNTPHLLTVALTHRSFLNEHAHSPFRTHNERLEFLGDAVLELVVTEFLYHHFPEEEEGRLTALRAALVNTDALAEVAEQLRIGECLLLSRGEQRASARARRHLIANALEAVIGAVYLDQGYDAARDLIVHTLLKRLKTVVQQGLWKDPKSTLQERAQAERGITPTYVIVEERGPEHAKEFVAAAYLDEEEVGRGSGPSKQAAQQAAAREALKRLGW